jgi:transposase
MQSFLTEAQRSEYKRLHKKSKEKRFADRIKSILALDRGYSFEEIAMLLMIDDTSVRRWYEQYLADGMDALLVDDYQGSDPKLSVKQLRSFTEHLEQHIYLSAKEICAHVQGRYGVTYTVTGITDLLHRLNFTYKKPKHIPGKADAKAQEAFIKKYKRLKKTLMPVDNLYFMDGVHPLHNSQPAYGWIKKGEEKELKANTGRQRININGAYDIKNHRLVFHEDESVNAQSTVALLQKLMNRQPQGKIHIISDNARYYRSKEVRTYLEKHRRIHFIFLPPYSPNLNLIERLWKFFKKKITYNRYYEKFAVFREECLYFLRHLSVYKEELKSLMTENFQLLQAA